MRPKQCLEIESLSELGYALRLFVRNGKLLITRHWQVGSGYNILTNIEHHIPQGWQYQLVHLTSFLEKFLPNSPYMMTIQVNNNKKSFIKWTKRGASWFLCDCKSYLRYWRWHYHIITPFLHVCSPDMLVFGRTGKSASFFIFTFIGKCSLWEKRVARLESVVCGQLTCESVLQLAQSR